MKSLQDTARAQIDTARARQGAVRVLTDLDKLTRPLTAEEHERRWHALYVISDADARRWLIENKDKVCRGVRPADKETP